MTTIVFWGRLAVTSVFVNTPIAWMWLNGRISWATAFLGSATAGVLTLLIWDGLRGRDARTEPTPFERPVRAVTMVDAPLPAVWDPLPRDVELRQRAG